MGLELGMGMGFGPKQQAAAGGGAASPDFTEDWSSGSYDTNWTIENDSTEASITDGNTRVTHTISGGAGDRLFGLSNDNAHSSDDGYIDIHIASIPTSSTGQGFLDFYFLSSAGSPFGGNNNTGQPRYYLRFINTSGSPVLQLFEHSSSSSTQIGSDSTYASNKTYRIAWTAESGGSRTITVTEDPEGTATEKFNETDTVPASLGTVWGFYNQCNSGQTREVKIGQIDLYSGTP